MQKEDWINTILESSADIKPVEPNPYLYQKLMSRLGESSNIPVKGSFVTGWTIAVIMTLVINITGVIAYTALSNQKNETAAVKAISNEIITSTTYNY
ncbi:MAG: hypothetical protein V4506_10790 [Bacteroidota bacterium]